MEWHFGYNCKNYISKFKKCRILIEEYKKRDDLLEKKTINIQDIMEYFNLEKEQLIRKIARGEIKAIRQKDGKIIFQILSAWQWDDCPLANAGGQCLYYEPHNDEKISCLADLGKITKEHPNTKYFTNGELRELEKEIIQKTCGNLIEE